MCFNAALMVDNENNHDEFPGAGAGPLQWVFLGELLPPDYKVTTIKILVEMGSFKHVSWRRLQVLSGIMVSLATLATFVVTKAFPSILSSSIGAPGAYWFVAF